MLPGSGKVKDRTLIAEYTGEDADDLADFPVNSLDCMVQDQSVNNSWKNLAGGLYDKFNNRKPSRQSMGGFMKDIQSSFENLSHEKIQSAIDIQPKFMKAIIAADGSHTIYMSNGSAKKRIHQSPVPGPKPGFEIKSKRGPAMGSRNLGPGIGSRT